MASNRKHFTAAVLPALSLFIILSILIFLVGKILLDSKMRDDEGLSICTSGFKLFKWFYSSKDFGHPDFGTSFYDHEPLFYAILWLWKIAFGSTKVALRLLPFALYAINCFLIAFICLRERVPLVRATLIAGRFASDRRFRRLFAGILYAYSCQHGKLLFFCSAL